MQITAALAAVKTAGLASRIPELFLGLTEPAKGNKRSGLRVLCDEYRIAMLDHDPGVGGRFSVLTNVGLLPASILGLDIAAVRAGATAALAPILDRHAPADVPAALGAALSVAIGKPTTVMMAYADRLERFTRWYVQLWAESLGKDGKGTTPIGALGPVDQHSQLQLFIAGPRDKLFTIVAAGTAGRGPRIEPDLANGCPVRTIHIERLDETSLGELLMHFMLETIIAAHLLGVDAFDQPAVEEGKVLAKKYLNGAS
jgi:glucose-6-phosphate isomerase